MKRARSTRQARLWPAAALLATAACATTPERPAPDAGPGLEASVGRIAERLVRSAELRTNLRSVRTRIDTIEPEHGTAGRFAADEGERIGTVLRRELMLVLVDDIYLVDSDADPHDRATLGEVSRAADAPPGATHRLVGDYVCVGGDVYLSMRLVDARTHVIVAAARGPIPLAALGDLSQPAGRVAAGATGDTGATTGATGAGVLGAAGILAAGAAQGAATTGPSGSPGGLAQAGEPRLLDSPPAHAQEMAVDPPVEKDFQAWRARRLAQQGTASGEGILPAAEDPKAIAESLEQWRRRRLADQSTSLPALVHTQADRPFNPGAGVELRYPWRTPELDRVLGIPADPSTAPDAAERPWRTRELAEILGVPPGE